MKTGRKVATAEEVSVTKGENLVANVTNSVAMSSPAVVCTLVGIYQFAYSPCKGEKISHVQFMHCFKFFLFVFLLSFP